MIRLRLTSAVLLCLIAGTSVAYAKSAPKSSEAETEETAAARAQFKRGVELYEDGDFDAALVQFRRAYASKPNFRVLYNIAQTQFQLRRYVEAEQALRQYLSDSAGQLPPARVSEVEADLQDLTTRIAKVAVQVNVVGATVLVDGQAVGKTPLDSPFSVSEGRRTIAVESKELGSKLRVVEVAGGDSVIVRLDFAARTPRTPVERQVAPQNGAPAATSFGTEFWVSATGTVLLGAGAATFGLLAIESEDQHREALDTLGTTRTALRDSSDQTKQLALTSDVLTIGAGVMLGLSLVFLLSDDDKQEQQLSLSVAPERVRLRTTF